MMNWPPGIRPAPGMASRIIQVNGLAGPESCGIWRARAHTHTENTHAARCCAPAPAPPANGEIPKPPPHIMGVNTPRIIVIPLRVFDRFKARLHRAQPPNTHLPELSAKPAPGPSKVARGLSASFRPARITRSASSHPRGLLPHEICADGRSARRSRVPLLGPGCGLADNSGKWARGGCIL